MIADAGPLIGLAKADALAILPALFGLVWITKAVHDGRAGRAEARHHRLALTGTAGIAVLAQEEGLIPSALQLLNDLRQVGYFLSDSVLRSVAQRLQSQVPQARS